MQNQCSQGDLPRVDVEPAPGEFNDLLREIEKEPVSERLLELARQLQAVLVSQRKLRESDGVRAGD
ncbi:MAG: hypothetical protein M9945_08360 [Aquamicrobium sp.]|uniref:hypothetical protein n=1 Tax=Aquamicrobium sp. TaxID=1872579 RepID=UPI00349E8F0D|nr:hypothetical protein [Aquamicrobium sp.]